MAVPVLVHCQMHWRTSRHRGDRTVGWKSVQGDLRLIIQNMGFTAAAPPVRELQPRAPTFRPLSLLVSFLLQLQFLLLATERLFPRHRADLLAIHYNDGTS